MNELVVQEIESLVSTSERLSEDASQSRQSLDRTRVQELTSIAARGGRLIERLYGSESEHYRIHRSIMGTKGFAVMYQAHCTHLAELVGLFKAVKHDIDTGMLAEYRVLVRAEIFSDFLEMAEYLLTEGYKDASAVLLGAVLENALRKIAEANGVSTINVRGKHLTIDPLNVALAKKSVYDALIQKQITSWANLRNDAAHGHHDRYDADQTKHMLLFVQKFCSDFLR